MRGSLACATLLLTACSALKTNEFPPDAAAPTKDSGSDVSAGASTATDASLDGSTPPFDASPPPVMDAASALDASDAGDAGGNAVDASDASPAAFTCASLTTADIVFCCDFDEESTPWWNWAYDLVYGKATVGGDTTDFVSPPNGFAASVPAFVTGDATLASLVTTFMSSAPHIDYSFEMFVKTYGGVAGSTTSPTVPVTQLEIGALGPTPLFLTLSLEGSQLHLVQSFPASDGGTQTASTPVPGTIGSKEWVKVEMLLDRSMMPWTVTVLLDGTSALNIPAQITVTDQTVQVELGIIGVVPPMAANAFTFDNTLVRAY
jgi:hypothetical protein